MLATASRCHWLCLAILFAGVAWGQHDDQDWTHYGGGPAGLQYSPLRQINTSNVTALRPQWIYRSGEMGEGLLRPLAFQSNPVVVNGRLFLSTGSGIAIALDAANGKEIWRFNPALDRNTATSEIANRGVLVWRDPQADTGAICAERVYIGILDSRLFSLDAVTGKPCEEFGENGVIWLNRGVRLRDSSWVQYLLTSPPIVVGDTLISGSAIGDNAAVEMELGVVRGFNARTGELRWSWDPIARAPEQARANGWEPQQAARTGAANAWAPLAADFERDMVFIPTGSASPDFYGGERLGDNRWANSLVALRASTGEFLWGQQLVHHDVWDYDTSAQPTLVDLTVDGERVPAVLQGNKTGMIYTFHRVTGEPLIPIEERPVPQSGVPGEALSPTQPFPLAPPPLARQQALTSDDAWGLFLLDEWKCGQEIDRYRSEGIFTPPSRQGSLMLPGYGGGINWGGIAFDPQREIAVAHTNELPTVVGLVPRRDFAQLDEGSLGVGANTAVQAGTPYGMWRKPLLSMLSVPCLTPPWGTISAVDMRAGTILWQKPLGTIEDIAPAPVPNLELGTPGMGGPIVTGSGLIFVGAAMDNYLRALDLASGRELWKGRLPASAQATPMTYFLESSGKQYVVIAAGGHSGIGTQAGDYLVAFALGN
jgi:quinoprotein glucose dehydrogenase